VTGPNQQITKIVPVSRSRDPLLHFGTFYTLGMVEVNTFWTDAYWLCHVLV